jgi:hypothetical protein
VRAVRLAGRRNGVQPVDAAITRADAALFQLGERESHTPFKLA